MTTDAVRPRLRTLRCFFAIVVLPTVMGCDALIPPRPPIGVPADAPVAQKQNDEPVVVVEAPGERFGGNWEDWHLFQIGDQIVGRAQTRASTLIDSELIRTGDPEVRIDRKEELIYRTGSLQFTQYRETSSVESYDGHLKSFEIEAQTGPVSMIYQGTVTNETIRIGVLRGGERESLQLVWDSTTRGLFAVEQSLRRRPMEVGETRRLRTAVPSLDAIGLSILRCTGEASVPMLEGDFRVLFEIELEILDAENLVVDQMVLWVDEKGVIQKSLRPSLRLESFRVSASKAKRLFSAARDDLRVMVAGNIDLTKSPKMVAMMVRGLEEEVAKEGEDSGPVVTPARTLFEPTERQSVRPGQTGLQVLYSLDPPPDGFEVFESSVRPGDTVATDWLDYDQPDIARLSKVVGELPPKDLLRELKNIANNVLSLGPQTETRRASMVVRSERAGDLDHTVVLAALLRSRAIPARVVLGLRPIEDEPADGFVTMQLTSWVLASIDNQWVTVDPLRKSESAFRVTLRVCKGEEDLRETIEEVFRKMATVAIEIRGVRYESADD
ncbi:MAG: transglutaminase-like domain-containing protein [Planctomycetota bacterium]